MSNSFGYLDIILLGMIAGFIILRLRSILGRKTGHESKVYPNFAEKKFTMPKNDAEPSKQNLDVLEGKDKKEFLRGAEIAYESVLTSFATGDLIKLKALLSPNMFSNFSDAIKARNKENIKSEFTFIGVKESSVENYEKIKDNLFATVKFVAEVISVKKDKENKIIEGNPDKIKFVTDSWKFTRNIKQKDLNWYLSEIISKWLKKKSPTQEDKKTWEEYIKNPSDIYDKDKNIFNNINKRERYIFDLHGLTLDDANIKVKEIIEHCVKFKFKELLLITGKGIHSTSDDDVYISKKLGKLKYSVPEYIKSNSELEKLIVSVSDADKKNGGEGAIIIKLKNL